MTKAAVAVQGDLADALGSNVKMMFHNTKFCSKMLTECLQTDDEQLKSTAVWTQEMIRRAFS